MKFILEASQQLTALFETG